MATTTIIAVGYTAPFTIYIYRSTRYYKKFTIKTKAGATVNIQGWTIFFTAKTPDDIATDATDATAIIKTNIVVPAVDADGAVGIFYLDIADNLTDLAAQKLTTDFKYLSGGERYPLMKFKAVVVDDVTHRISV